MKKQFVFLTVAVSSIILSGCGTYAKEGMKKQFRAVTKSDCSCEHPANACETTENGHVGVFPAGPDEKPIPGKGWKFLISKDYYEKQQSEKTN